MQIRAGGFAMSTRKIIMWTLASVLLTGGVLIVYFLGGFTGMLFTDLETFEVNDFREFDAGPVGGIEISASGTDTDIIVVDSPKIMVSLKGTVRTQDASFVPYIEADVIGNTLRIEIKKKSSSKAMFYSGDVRLTLEIPESFTGHLAYNGASGRLNASRLKLNSCKLATSSGDISLGDLEVNGIASVHATSGRIGVEKLQASSASFMASSGDIYLGDITVREGFSADASSGQIVIESLIASNATLKNTSGDKRIASLTVSGEAVLEGNSGSTKLDRVSTGKLVIRSSSGDVSAETARSGQTTIQTSSGRISVKGLEGDADLSSGSGSITLQCEKPASSIQIASSSGSVNLSLPGSAQFTLDAQTSSGRIRTDFSLEKSSSGEKYLRGSVGNGSLAVFVKTTSGNITVSKN